MLGNCPTTKKESWVGRLAITYSAASYLRSRTEFQASAKAVEASNPPMHISQKALVNRKRSVTIVLADDIPKISARASSVDR